MVLGLMAVLLFATAVAARDQLLPAPAVLLWGGLRCLRCGGASFGLFRWFSPMGGRSRQSTR
eukprot:15449315-Alexandrium_andersonii.AAC.1